MLKISSITLIPKSGSNVIISNYRSISIQSHISKIFDTLVLNYIQPQDNRIIMEKQHGFRSGHSTTNCNIIFSNFVHESLQVGTQVDVVYTDFNKAFDSVNHCDVVKILEKSGFGEPLLTWFKSYIDNRQQWVNVLSFKSYAFLASPGVPQGSHSSPFLFSLFVNSVCHVLLMT